MSLHLDLDDLEARIRDLDVQVRFTPETGFPYLRDKLGEVMEKNQQATAVMCQLIGLIDLVRREIAAQTMLTQQTGSDVHKAAATEARGQMETLKSVQVVMKLHLDRLRRLPHDIRLYTRVLESALSIEPTAKQALAPTTAPVPALPTALSSMGRPLVSDPVEFSTDDLFAGDVNVEDLFDVRT
jgi:hypothetical protein